MRSNLLGAMAVCFSAAWLAMPAHAVVIIAQDNASNSTYNDGWQTGDNGGSGFGSWTTINNISSGGFGGGFISSNNAAVNIGSGSSNKAFGVFGNQNGVGQAIRSLGFSLAVGQTLSLDMDNQSIANGGTVGFALRNSSQDNLAEFFFVGGQTNYKLNAKGGSQTGPGFTLGGLRFTLTLTDTNTFVATADLLADGLGTNVTTFNADLFDNANQGVSQLRLFNSNGGADVFFNNFAVTAIPESSALAFGGLATCIACLTFVSRRAKRAKTAAAETATTAA